MKKHILTLFGAGLSTICAVCALSAQTPRPTHHAHPNGTAQQVSNIRSSVDSIPQTTVVPVQQPPLDIADYTTVFEAPGEGLNRVERRALRAKNHAACIDSLVQSHNYVFYPDTMQEMPEGTVHRIYTDYFFFGLFADHAEVHLPVDRAGSQYIERVNFDSMAISNYRISRVQCGWMISFDIADGDARYHASFTVCTATGQTTLTFITPSVTMRYVGSLGDRQRIRPHTRP